MTLFRALALALLALPTLADASPTRDRLTASATVGVGIVQFTGSAMREHAAEGVGWETRVAFGAGSDTVFELGYLGTLHEVDGSNLLGSIFEGVFKVPLGFGAIQPYAIAGIGWGHYKVTDPIATMMERTDNVATYPLGGGLTVKRGELVLDVRCVYRIVDHVDLLQGGSRLDAWSATIGVGAEY